MSTNSKWYTLKVDPTTVMPETFQRLKGNVVNEDFLMHAPDTDALFFCIENGIGQRAMIPAEAITPLQAYRNLEQKLIGARIVSNGYYSPTEDHFLSLMDEVWADLTSEEQAILEAEGPQAKNMRSEDKPQDPQVAQPCN